MEKLRDESPSPVLGYTQRLAYYNTQMYRAIVLYNTIRWKGLPYVIPPGHPEQLRRSRELPDAPAASCWRQWDLGPATESQRTKVLHSLENMVYLWDVTWMRRDGLDWK